MQNRKNLCSKAPFLINEYERWAYQVRDTLENINERLATRTFLLGEKITEADKLLYQTLLRLDSIDIVKEKEEAFLSLSDDRNPYHLIFRGPEV